KAEALRSVERVLAVQPNLMPAREQWAGLMLQTGKVAEAVEEARRIIQTSPNNRTARLILARAAETARRPPEAREHYQAIPAGGHLRPDAAEWIRRKIAALR